jgi:lipopolysaccharide transport system ATP-binding protein
MAENVIKVEGVGKLYRLGEIGTGTISHDLNRWWARVRGKEDPFAKIGVTNDRTVKGDSDYVWALKDINFSVKQGEVLGIIGHNGAGKSTLLKILSKVTTPSAGKIKVKGRIASLLEVGTGFHPELTGRENIFLNGAILGMTKAEIRSKFDEIVDFAGVERYIDTPVKRYSSGMYVRLAFSVAAFLESEILIVDEVLAVGDMDFQKKCISRMDRVAHSEGRTVLFVSHDLNAVAQLCESGLLMDKGTVVLQDAVLPVVSQYLSKEQQAAVYNHTGKKNKSVFIEQIKMLNESEEVCSDYTHTEPIYIDFKINIHDTSVKCNLFVLVLDQRKRRIFACESEHISAAMRLKIMPELLVRGRYTIHAFVNIPRAEQLDVVEDACSFTVIDVGSSMLKHGDYDYGMVLGKYEWIR